MPKNSKKSDLFGKYRARAVKAHEEHKDDETEFGFSELPDGIENGVAQLVEAKLDVYKKGKNKGEPFFLMTGIVVLPKTHAGVPLKGGRTQVMEPLCDTPGRSRGDFEDHLAWVYNQLRMLGVDTSELDFDDLESTLEDLKEESPYFKFRTWKGEATKQYPSPRVNHSWNGIIEDFDPETSNTEGVEDETEDEGGDDEEEEAGEDELEEAEVPPRKTGKKASAPPAGAPTKPAGKPKPAAEPKTQPGGGKGKPPDKKKAPAAAEEFDEEQDLDGLAKKADKGDEDAVEKLKEMATAAGIDEETVDDAANWKAVAKMIREGGPAAEEEETEDEEEATDEEEESGDEEEEAAEEFVPKKGDIHLYRPLDPKSKKPVKKALEVEVTKVYDRIKCADLRNLDTKVIYSKVKWEALEQGE